MNKLILIFCFVFISLSLIAQGKYSLALTIYDNNSRMQENIKVWIKDQTTGNVITKRTDSNGNVNFEISTGLWTLNLVGMLNYEEFEVTDNTQGKANFSIVYDINQIIAQELIIQKRASISFKEIDATKASELKDGFSTFIVSLKNSTKQAMPSVEVNLVNIYDSTIYKNKTDYTGIATFSNVPAGVRYAIDIDGIKNFTFSRLIKPNGEVTIFPTYDPAAFKQTIKNDTVIQVLMPDMQIPSGYAFMKVLIYDDSHALLSKEKVYIRGLLSGKIYVTKSDDKGCAYFMVPNGDKYMVDFNFQKDVDVFNLIHSTKSSKNKLNLQVTYRPDSKLQHPEDYLPTPENLFIQEFENFITKQTPDPIGKPVSLDVHWSNDKVNKNSKSSILNIDVAIAQDAVNTINSPLLNIAFVLDKSGSMAGYTRIEALKTSLAKFITKLRSNDKLALVSFNDNATLDCPSQLKGDGKLFGQIINEIEPDGGTNMLNGMLIGYEQVAKNFDAKRTNKIIVLTDGYDSNEPKILVEKTKEEQLKGIGLSAIGVGYDYNTSLLELMTKESGGLVMHVKESADMYDVFEKQFSSLLTPFAKDAKIEIVFNKRIDYKQVYSSKNSVKKTDRVEIPLGTL